MVSKTKIEFDAPHEDLFERAWVITDLGSTNGTRVNNARVAARAPLADGDVLALGTVRLQVLH